MATVGTPAVRRVPGNMLLAGVAPAAGAVAFTWTTVQALFPRRSA
ncbi:MULTISPECIES: hypothetical protein [unclassified Nonomuraea]